MVTPPLDPRPAPDEVVAVYRVGLHQLLRDDSPRFIAIPESPRPVVQLPLGNDLIHAPWESGPIELETAGVELGRDYPRPIVDHAEARAKTLQRYAVVKKAAGP